MTSYDAQTGHQLAQSPHLFGSPLDIEILSPDWPGDDDRDIVTLSSGGRIRRFRHHELVWEASTEKYSIYGSLTNLQCQRKSSLHCNFAVENIYRIYCSTYQVLWHYYSYVGLGYRKYYQYTSTRCIPYSRLESSSCWKPLFRSSSYLE